MLCNRCGYENRPTACFCARCGASLSTGSAIETPPTPKSEPTQVASKAGILGGHSLITIGALLILFAFMLPWASCNGYNVSGMDLATQPDEYKLNESARMLLLVPLGALGLLAMGVLGLGANILNIFVKTIPAMVNRLVAIVPAALAALAWLCGCCPSLSFFLRFQEERADTFGEYLKIEYGFWLNVFGLLLVLLGIVLAVIGGVIGLLKRPSTGVGPPTASGPGTC